MLILSCSLNGINPEAYLAHVIGHVSQHLIASRISSLGTCAANLTES
ncbi:transposase domain-containing protein [Mesorhizobium sp. f-mel]